MSVICSSWWNRDKSVESIPVMLLLQLTWAHLLHATSVHTTPLCDRYGLAHRVFAAYVVSAFYIDLFIYKYMDIILVLFLSTISHASVGNPCPSLPTAAVVSSAPVPCKPAVTQAAFWAFINRLEHVAINDALPLKAARRDAIANLKCFWASDTRDLISMVTYTVTMRRHLIRLASAPFISSHLATFGWVRLPCATREKHNAEFTKRGWELWSYFKQFVDQSSGKPLYFPTPVLIVCVTLHSEDIRH